MRRLIHRELTYAVIGAAMEVHQILGPGFLEAVYDEAVAHEFDMRGIAYHRQKRVEVSYKEQGVGLYTCDYVVESCLIVELKASKQLTGVDEAQLINYLKATGYRVGLLINFGGPSLQHRRRVF